MEGSSDVRVNFLKNAICEIPIAEQSFTYPENVVDEALVATEDLCVVKPPVTKKNGRTNTFVFADDVLQAKNFLNCKF